MNRKESITLILLFMAVLFYGCATSYKNYNPEKKFPKDALKTDFFLVKNILESKHPSLYWYSPKDSMDRYFSEAENAIKDSMTEMQFAWQVLAPLTHKIHCGHTSIIMSKGWSHYIKKVKFPSFPLYLKIWKDTMVVTGNLNHKDSVIKNGTQITSINGLSCRELTNKIFSYLPLDGYADNVNYIRISGNFPYYHRNIWGVYDKYNITYIDSSGVEKSATLPLFVPGKDSTKKKQSLTAKSGIARKEKKKEYRDALRSFSIDTSINTGILTLNTFSREKGTHLRRFFRISFKKMRKGNIQNLILDIRGNGGGNVGMYILLTKYLRNKPFKVADSCYAASKSLTPYTRHIRNGVLNNIELFFLARKKNDGNYHFGYWERHYFHPKRRTHFNGNVYVLINGPTFSAATLFCSAVKGQKNITLAGEETGGGWYGNSGISIPEIKLPISKLRVRLPIFRLVQFNHTLVKGTGVVPDIYIPPTIEGVANGLDRKMILVKGLIRNARR